jgi:hypothetical protein
MWDGSTGGEMNSHVAVHSSLAIVNVGYVPKLLSKASPSQGFLMKHIVMIIAAGLLLLCAGSASATIQAGDQAPGVCHKFLIQIAGDLH